jgi:hypothetical protein
MIFGKQKNARPRRTGQIGTNAMGNVSAPRRRRNQNFDLNAKRRREIVLHARLVGAHETEDFPRWLIAWHWYNPKAKDPIWSLMEAAKSMGGKISEAEASAVTEEASITRKHLTADNLARFLGVTYAQREALHLTTIGSVNVGKRARKALRKRQDRLAKERKRRALGMRPQSESLSATQPWRELGMSRRTWERHRNKARDATLSAAIFLSSEDRPATPEGGAGLAERGFASKEVSKRRPSAAPPKAANLEQCFPSSRTATTMAADRYVSEMLVEFSPEARMGALGLKVSGAKIACAA